MFGQRWENGPRLWKKSDIYILFKRFVIDSGSASNKQERKC